jgi:FHA domain
VTGETPTGEKPTTTDRNRLRGEADDAVRRLRVWGSHEAFELPPLLASPRDLIVGSSRTCAIHLQGSGISREHFQLYVDGKLRLVDLSSKNGTYLDGMRTPVGACALMPGTEVCLGQTTMIAESTRHIELREFIGQLLGWSDLVAVDQALRSIRRAEQRRSVLYLNGSGDLSLVAYSLHRRLIGTERPFVMCDPRRRARRGSVRSVANRPKGIDGYRVAAGGMLCLCADRLPRDFEALVRLQTEADVLRPMIVVIGDRERRRNRMDIVMNPPVCVPSISRRASDLPEIVDSYGRAAAAELHLPALLAEDRAWVIKNSAATFAEIEKGTRRAIAIRSSSSLAAAAERLQMAAISLRRWLDRREALSSVVRRVR